MMMVIKAVCSFECIAFFNNFDKEVEAGYLF